MTLDERDIALADICRTRQLWAEKLLDFSLSPQDRESVEWCNYLHAEVGKYLKSTLRKAKDLTPASPEEAFSDEYQERLMSELQKPGYKIGAYFIQDNAFIGIPLILAKPDNCEAEVYLLAEFPIPDPNRSLVSRFMCIKTRFVEQQLAQIGLKVTSPKILKPSITDDPCRPLKTRLTGLRKMKYYNDLRDDEDRASRAIKEANRVLANPLEPPGEGQLFKPLDLAFLSDKEHSFYRIAYKEGFWCFNDFLQVSRKVNDDRELGYFQWQDSQDIQSVCLSRGVEAVRQVNNPEDWFTTGKKALVCSVAAIPLAEYSDTPLAAVFSWKEDGKLCSANFRLGDFHLGNGCADLDDPVSDRLRSFVDRVRHGDFTEVVSSEDAKRFSGRWSGDIRAYQDVIFAGHYFSPELDGLSLREQAAVIGMPGPEPELQNKPAAYLELAALINKNPASAEIDNNPTLKAIFAELFWQNQAMLKLADAVAARCAAAQALGGEHFAEVSGFEEGRFEEGDTYLLFPQGTLERAVGAGGG